MKKPFIQIDSDDFYQPGYNPRQLEGCILPINFPFCCPSHTSVFDGSLSWFIQFPGCCKNHREMANKSWFNKTNYAAIPIKVVTLIYYTEFFIINAVKKANWFEEICNYIEYCVHTFGHPNTGMFLYYTYLIRRLEKDSGKILDSKLLKIIEYLKLQYEGGAETPVPSLNVLFDTYNNWLNTFPFDIIFFKDLRKEFEKTLPFLQSKPEYNRFTGLSKAKIVTQDQLIINLVNTTQKLLQEVQIDKINNIEIIAHSEQLAFELMKERHRLKQKKLLNNYSIDEMPYVTVLNEWLTNEIEFFTEMRSFINTPLQVQLKNSNINEHLPVKPTITAYAIMHVYLERFEGTGITQQNKTRLAKEYGYNSGDRLRNEYVLYQNDEKRLDLHTNNKKSATAHLERYKSILPLLQKMNNRAFQAANKDLQLLEKAYNKHY